MHAKHPVIERHQFRVQPVRIDEMNEVTEFFKAEQKKQMWIPVPPKMPETCGDFDAFVLRAFLGARSCDTKHADQRSHNRLHTHQLPGMREIF